MITKNPATVTAETEDAVVVTTDAGEAYAIPYWAIPAAYTTGDAVELTVEEAPATAPNTVGAVYVTA